MLITDVLFNLFASHEMIHPDTEVRFISENIGHGVFATAPLPKGTILYVVDSLEIEVTPKQFNKLNAKLRKVVDTYSYINERGLRIVSWDNAKYVNHRCECNSMSTGYGFEIAIKDIAAGEEITDEYGLFNLTRPMPVNCGCSKCRRVIYPNDADTYLYEWDEIIKSTLPEIKNTPQPLWDYMGNKTTKEVSAYLFEKKPYKSIDALRYRPIESINNYN